jgi:FkbM family methyltransferase
VSRRLPPAIERAVTTHLGGPLLPFQRLKWGGRRDGRPDYERSPAAREAIHDRRREASQRGDGSPYLLAEAAGAVFCVSTADRGVSRKLYVRRRVAVRPVLERAIEILGSLGSRPEGLFVDVGAHIGTATVSALGLPGLSSAIAFEPEPENFRMLQVNLLLNRLDRAAIAVQAAVSDFDGRIPLHVYPDVHGGHRVITREKQRRRAQQGRADGVIDVDAVTLDTALERHALTPDRVGLVKIDAQGHEPQILTGATGLMEAGAPILVEYWPAQLEKRAGLGAFEELVAANFDMAFDLGQAGPPLRAAELPDLRAAYREKEKTDLLLVRDR